MDKYRKALRDEASKLALRDAALTAGDDFLAGRYCREAEHHRAWATRFLRDIQERDPEFVPA